MPTGQPQDWPAGAQDGSPQPKLPAGGSGGGNRHLYDVLYTVTATVKNTGDVKGTEIPQLVCPRPTSPSPSPSPSSLPTITSISTSSLITIHTTHLTKPPTVHLPRRPHRSQDRPARLHRPHPLTRRIPHFRMRHHASRYLELGFGDPELGHHSLSQDRVCRGE